MGPSGSGKVHLNLIAGIDTPDFLVLINGVEISKLDGQIGWLGKNIGFIFQFYNLIPVLTALENVELPLKLTQHTKKIKKLAYEALEKVGLFDR